MTALESDLFYGKVKPDKNGMWSMPDIEFKGKDHTLDNYVLVVQAGSHKRILAANVRLGPGDDLVIHDPLLEGQPFELKFVLADGRPAVLAGEVILAKRSSSYTGAESPTPRLHAVIDAAGSLSLPGLPPGTWEWSVEAQGTTRTVSGTVVHESNKPTQRTVKLGAHIDIRGRMTGKQLGQAEVYWHVAGEEENVFGSVVTHADGTFFVPLVPVGSTVKLGAVTSRYRPLGEPDRLAPGWPEGTVTVTARVNGLQDVTLAGR